MKFIDQADIKVWSGHGGAGSRSFRREKFIPMGGPDGGNGGAGGSVIIVADERKSTLLDFQFKPAWKAQDGKPGQGSLKDGKQGQDLEISVPVGTQIYNHDGSTLIADLTYPGQRFVLAKGGRGGKGNDFFKSSTNQAPQHFQPGEEGQSGIYRLSLKLVADVGLIGFPNAGKSTLISRISSARPKIADYPFTTLVPNLGVVQTKGKHTFVVADIPGLIAGAHSGRGLGTQFLKHVERTKLLVHLIDPNQLDETGQPVDILKAYDTIQQELTLFSEQLVHKPQLVVISKSDSIPAADVRKKLQGSLSTRGIKSHLISSVSGEGLADLIEVIWANLDQINQAQTKPELTQAFG